MLDITHILQLLWYSNKLSFHQYYIFNHLLFQGQTMDPSEVTAPHQCNLIPPWIRHNKHKLH